MISRFVSDSEFHTDERCHIVEIQNSDDDPGCSIARARVEPGVTTQLHALCDTAERYVILSGVARAVIGGEPTPLLGPLDVVSIPAGVSQQITNTGSEDLVFLCICTPRFRQENYRDLAG